MKKQTHYYKQAGFSMLEVLITIAITSFALLGLAAMFMKGVQNSHSSLLRSVASQQVYNLADRMRANPAGLQNGSYANVSFSGVQTCQSCASSCSPGDIAAYDVCTWNNQNIALLPLGRGVVEKNDVAYSIKVSWDDSRSGSADTDFILTLDP